MPKLYRGSREDAPLDVVNLHWEGRWENPHKSGVHGTKEECVAKYRQQIEDNPPMQTRIRRELRGRDLYCACLKDPCHGEVLLELANDGKAEELDELI